MTATMAVEMAADGDLIILVKESAVMSDKEVTELVSRWEQKQDSTSIDKIEVPVDTEALKKKAKLAQQNVVRNWIKQILREESPKFDDDGNGNLD